MASSATINRPFRGASIETVIPLGNIGVFAGMVVNALIETGANIGIPEIRDIADIDTIIGGTSQANNAPFIYDNRVISTFKVLSKISDAAKQASLSATPTGYQPVDRTIENIVNVTFAGINLPQDVKISIAKLSVLFYIDEVNRLFGAEQEDVVSMIQSGSNPVAMINSIPNMVLSGWTNNTYTFAVSTNFPNDLVGDLIYSEERDDSMNESSRESSMDSSSPSSGSSSLDSSRESSAELPDSRTANTITYTYDTVGNNRITLLIPIGVRFIDYLKEVKMLLKESAEDNEIELDSIEHVIETALNVEEDGEETLIEGLPQELIEGIRNYDPATDPNALVINGIVSQGYFNPPLVSLSFAAPIGDQAKIPLATLIVRSWAYHTRTRDFSDIANIVRSIIENRTTVQREIAATRTANVSLLSANLDANRMNEFTFRLSDRDLRSPSPSSSEYSSSTDSNNSIPEALRVADPSTIIPLDQDVKNPLDPDSPPFDLSTITTFPTLQDLIRTLKSMPSDTPIDISEILTPCDYTDMDPVMFEPYAKSEKGSFVVFMIPTKDGGYNASCISIEAFPIPPAYNNRTGKMEDDPRNTNYFANWVLKKYNTNINQGNGDGGRPGTRRFSKIPIPFSIYIESQVFDYIKTMSDAAISRQMLPIFWLQALPPIRLGRASNTAGNPFVGELHGQDPLETPYGIVAFGELPFANMPEPEVD